MRVRVVTTTLAGTLLLTLVACSPLGGGPGGGGLGGTPAVSACPTHATATAQARVVGQQLKGHVGSAPDGALSDFRYPLGLPNEDVVVSLGNLPHPGYSVFAPDGSHLATTVLLEGPNIVSSYPYLVDTTTHTVTRLPLPDSLNVDGAYFNEWLRERSLAWIDARTLLFFGGANTNTTVTSGSSGSQVFVYDIVSHTRDVLPGVTAAAGGVVRCGILYYQEVTPLAPFGPDGWLKGELLLHRYNLGARAEIGRPLELGETFGFGGAESHFDGPGWDVSPDGRHLVYQESHVVATADHLEMSSRIISANPDGTNASAILLPAAPSVTMLISISPTNQLVAATDGDVDAFRDVTTAPPPSAALTMAGGLGGGSASESFVPVGTVLPAWTAGDRFLASRADTRALDGVGLTTESYHVDGAISGAGTAGGTDATYVSTLTP